MPRSFDGATPIYLQIAEEIRLQILSASLYRINPATANKAVALLVDEGLVVKRRGIGMFVADGARAALQAARRRSYAAKVLGPALATGRLLGLTEAEILQAAHDYLQEET